MAKFIAAEKAVAKRKLMDKDAELREKTRAEAKEWLSKVGLYKGYDPASLFAAMDKGDIPKMQELIKQADELYAKYDTLTTLDNPRQYAADFTFEELQKTEEAVKKTLSAMPSDLSARKAKLEFEINWVEDKKKYPTWKIAQEAYKKELNKVEDELRYKALLDIAKDILAEAATMTDKEVKKMAAELSMLINTKPIDEKSIRDKSEKLKKKIDAIAAKGRILATSDREQKCETKTIQQLKKEGNCPATLTNLQKAIDKYEQSWHYGSGVKAHAKEIEAAMRDLFNKHDFGMNISDYLLESLYNSHFKNTFEVGGSKGYVGSHKTTGKIEVSHNRLRASHEMFGVGDDLQNDQLKRKQYEKYGNLLDHDILAAFDADFAYQYGNVHIRFKKDKVVATWTPCDSLGAGHQPSLCSDPKACSYDRKTAWIPTKTGKETDSFVNWKRQGGHAASYLELQYHGDLTID